MTNNETRFPIPFTVPMDAPTRLLINYEPPQKEAVMASVRAFIMNLLAFMPQYSFTIIYIDPKDYGASLGELLNLRNITYFDVCREVYATEEKILGRFKELESFITTTTSRLAGAPSVYQAAGDKEELIPRQFVIINDFPDNFERPALKLLKVILGDTGRKCGISCIFTTGRGTDGFPPEIKEALQDFTVIQISGDGKGVVHFNNDKFAFRFEKTAERDTEKRTTADFVKRYVTFCNEGSKNEFKDLTDAQKKVLGFKQPWPPRNVAKEGLTLPLAVDSQGSFAFVELGGALTVNALLSGRTGSGKSTTLHMLIMAIIMNYSPKDVELWLVDYKQKGVEFNQYIANPPPHIRFIALERGQEFSASLVEKILAEIERRNSMFKERGVEDIAKYNALRGVAKMGRVILIIDEFHHLTQAAEDDPLLKRKLENILSECRSSGLSCVFSDQAIVSGLQGLSQKARDQINVRIAMCNSLPELKETLFPGYSSLPDEGVNSKLQSMTGAGDENRGIVMFKALIKDASGDRYVMDKYRTVYMDQNDRSGVIKWTKDTAEHTGCAAGDCFIRDGRERKKYAPDVVKRFETDNKLNNGKQLPLYLGEPSNLDPCFYIPLRRRGDNLLVIGADEDLRASVVFYTIFSVLRSKPGKAYLFAGQDDELYDYFEAKGLLVQLEKMGVSVVTDSVHMCRIVSQTRSDMESTHPTDAQARAPRALFVWLGLEDIAKELLRFDTLGSIPGAGLRQKTMSKHAAEINNSIGAWDAPADQPVSMEEPEAAAGNLAVGNLADGNPSEDIPYILTWGPRFGVFNIASFSAYKALERTQFVKAEFFTHKVASSMGEDESFAYLGNTKRASGLDQSTAVYFDGSSLRTFRPYLLPALL